MMAEALTSMVVAEVGVSLSMLNLDVLPGFYNGELVKTCLDVQKAACKALRFGLNDQWPGYGTNYVVLLSALAFLAREADHLLEGKFGQEELARLMDEKRRKGAWALEYSRKQGTLDD
jgi:hypothetical protein